HEPARVHLHTPSLHDALPISDRTSGPVQQAVATLLEGGDLDRHLRRMRLEYARRRAVVVEVLSPVCRLRGDTAGLHVLAELPPRSEEHTSELQSRENLVCRLL